MYERFVYRMPVAGSIKNLGLKKEQSGKPEAEEVRVKIKAIGLNFADIFAMQGLYSATPKGSFIPGLEFSGEVTEAGKMGGPWQVGDKVMGATKFGGYASAINIDHRYVIPLPDEWSFEEGAGFLVQGLTAYYALLELGNLQKGMTVLIHSAAGGVGLLANRICKRLGAYTIGTVGRPDKVAFLQQKEAYDKIILRNSYFPEKLQGALEGRELQLVMECIGGSVLRQGWEAMAPMGRMVVYGNASFTSHTSRPNYPKLLWKYLRRPTIDPLKLPGENKSLMGFNLIHLYEKTELMHRMLDQLQGLSLAPQHIGHVYPFRALPEAVKLFQQGKTIGKVVVKVEE